MGIQQNLIDLVWGKDRPARPSEKVRVHPVKYAGKSFQDKVADLRKELESRKQAGFIICTVPLPPTHDNLSNVGNSDFG